MAHEVAHGAAAYAFGDSTARDLGRLSLNPIKHIDLWGSIVVPGFLILSGAGFVLGWAKPVPYNPYNLKNRRLGEFCVAIAGIVVNICLAVFFSLVLRYHAWFNISASVLEIIAYIVIINLVLAVFNLMPVPPLDGSKILFSVLPYRYQGVIRQFEQYGLIAVIILVMFFGQFISNIVFSLFYLLTSF